MRSDLIKFNVHQDLDFLSCLRLQSHKENISCEGKKGWYALSTFGLLVKPFPTAFKTKFEGLTKHLEFNDEYQDRQTMPLTFNQCNLKDWPIKTFAQIVAIVVVDVNEDHLVGGRGKDQQRGAIGSNTTNKDSPTSRMFGRFG